MKHVLRYENLVKESDVVSGLAYSPDPKHRRTAASLERTSPEMLRRLASDDDLMVRTHVASNPNTPTDVLAALIDDDNAVIAALSGNPSTPEEVLLTITKFLINAGPSWFQKSTINFLIRNPSTPIEAKREMLRGARVNSLLELAQSRNTQAEILIELANHPNGELAEAARENPNFPEDLDAWTLNLDDWT